MILRPTHNLNNAVDFYTFHLFAKIFKKKNSHDRNSPHLPHLLLLKFRVLKVPEKPP